MSRKQVEIDVAGALTRDRNEDVDKLAEIAAISRDSHFHHSSYTDDKELYDEDECTELGNYPVHALWNEAEGRIKAVQKEGLSVIDAEKLENRHHELKEIFKMHLEAGVPAKITP